jgi:hypothetical protein
MNLIKNFSEYIDYFKQIAEGSAYFKFFRAGGAERIVSERLLSDARSRIEGPLMFCEWPFMRINDYGSQNNLLKYTGAIVILENPDKEDWNKQDEAMNNTFNAVIRLLSQMKVDSTSLNKRFIYFDLNQVAIDPIENLMLDSWFGWRCEFGLYVPADIAINEECLYISP